MQDLDKINAMLALHARSVSVLWQFRGCDMCAIPHNAGTHFDKEEAVDGTLSLEYSGGYYLMADVRRNRQVHRVRCRPLTWQSKYLDELIIKISLKEPADSETPKLIWQLLDQQWAVINSEAERVTGALISA